MLRWTQCRKMKGTRQSLLFLLSSWSLFLWQGVENGTRWQSPQHASLFPGNRESWNLWAISFAVCRSLRPHVIKLSLWERGRKKKKKKKKTTCDLTCWFPANTTAGGQKVREQKLEEGRRKFAAKICPPSKFLSQPPLRSSLGSFCLKKNTGELNLCLIIFPTGIQESAGTTNEVKIFQALQRSLLSS